jgi:hypothetical protein
MRSCVRRQQSATTRVWGSIGSVVIFAEGTAHTTTKWDVYHAGLARYRQGVVRARGEVAAWRARSARCTTYPVFLRAGLQHPLSRQNRIRDVLKRHSALC